MKTFSEKQTLAITAARIAGLLRALYHETEFVDTKPQILLETEYLPLYCQLQDICFNSKGEIRWLLLNALEKTNDKHQDIVVYKTDLGFGIEMRGRVRLEVASKLEARVPGELFNYDFPSVIRSKMTQAVA